MFLETFKFENMYLNDYVKYVLGDHLSLRNNDILGTCKIRDLDSEEKVMFLDFFDLNIITNIICGDRAVLNLKTYHSRNYKFKRSSNSFTVCFLRNKEEKYGEILEFYSYNKEIFVKISEFTVYSDLKSFLPESTGYFYTTLMNNLLNRFFKIVGYQSSNKITLIKGIDIKCKCIVFDNSEYVFITPVSYEYEHD